MSLTGAGMLTLSRVAAAVGVGAILLSPEQGLTIAAPPAGEALVIVGTVADIRSQSAPHSRRDWAITVHVDKVTLGKFSGATFSFSVHSPARAGLVVGHTYIIKATWNGEGYDVDETQWHEPGTPRINGAG